jgi:hypothetical protein
VRAAPVDADLAPDAVLVAEAAGVIAIVLGAEIECAALVQIISD